MELKKNTYEFGLVVGTKRERDYWQNKIKEKIEELKSDEEKLKQDEDYVPIYQIKSKIKVLQELLKGE